MEKLKGTLQKMVGAMVDISMKAYSEVINQLRVDDMKVASRLYKSIDAFMTENSTDFGYAIARIKELAKEHMKSVGGSDIDVQLGEDAMKLYRAFQDVVRTDGHVYVSNAFSLNMLEDPQGSFSVEKVSREAVPDDAVSAIGHEDMARLLGFEFNRVSLSLRKGDVLYVAQYRGERLTIGATSLPDGAQITWLRVQV